MLTEFVEIRNFLDNPYEVMALAKQQMFVQRDAHYHNIARDTFYNGVRSRELKDIDETLYKNIMNRVFQKTIDLRFGDNITKKRIDYDFEASAYFHIMRGTDLFDSTWMHKDTNSILAGVIYLNPNPEPNSGTIVHRYGDDKEPVIVENEFNKLVMYDTSYLHAPQAGFGSDVNESRLTMVFFIGQISLRVGLAKHMDKECLPNE